MKHTPRTVRTARRPGSDLTPVVARRSAQELTAADLAHLAGLVACARIGARSRG